MRSARASGRLREFAKLHREVEGVVQRCGRETFDLLLIDVEGNWTRDIVASAEEAAAAGRDLGIRLHDGWDDARVVRRMSRRDHWGQPEGQRRAV